MIVVILSTANIVPLFFFFKYFNFEMSYEHFYNVLFYSQVTARFKVEISREKTHRLTDDRKCYLNVY